MSIRIETKSGVFEIEAEQGESVLFAGLRAGLTLPYECATGTCGTCRARVMSGEVDRGWSAAPGLSKIKPEKGDVLMCQCRADGACVVRVPAMVERDPASAPALLGGAIDVHRPLTGDVVHFEVALSAPARFKAGQFMVVTAPGLPGGRAYSMVNFAPETDRLSFVVKRKPGGGFSDWLFDGPASGAEVTLFGPLGAATFDPAEDADLICIAGGSGVAGLVSILDHATNSDFFERRKAQLFFGVRTLADGFYLAELAEMVRRSRGALSVTLALSDVPPSGPAHPDFPEIALAGGFVHEAAAAALSEPSPDAIGFVAGPPPMVDGAIRTLIATAGLPPTRIRYDKFS